MTILESAIKDLFDAIEEIKRLQSELEKNSQELEAYKKALKLMQINEVCMGCVYNFDNNCEDDKVEECLRYYLQKARGEE